MSTAIGMKIKLTVVIAMLSTSSAKVIDLSHPHGPNTIMSFPDTPRYNNTVLRAGEWMPGVYVESGMYQSGEHGGTHMDAPKHFMKGGRPLDQIPIEETILDGVMIDCSKEAMAKKDYAVSVMKLEEWERENGEIPCNSAVLFNFGWSSKFGNEAQYRGTNNVEDLSTYTFPSLSKEAGKWLFENRNVHMIGSDTITIDAFYINGKKNTPSNHILFLQNNRYLMENLRDLHRLPPRGFRFHATPVKYVDATGAQVRAFAMTYDEYIMKNGVAVTCCSLFAMFCCLLGRITFV